MRERNAAGGAGEVPNRMLPRPFIGNARANLAAENIEIESEIGAFLIEPRQVDGDGLKVQTAGEIHSADSETVLLPLGRAPQLRKRLSK